jgi:hypothetical protein
MHGLMTLNGTRYAVGDQTGRLRSIKAGFGGDISCQTRDRLIQGSTSRFVPFAHFVLFVVQTPST